MTRWTTAVDRSDTDVITSSSPTAGDLQQSRRVRSLRDWHWAMLILSAFVVIASFVLQFDGSDHLAPAGLPNLPLPAVCGSRLLFGVDCPGCGLSRSFVALAHGDLLTSFRLHHVGWVIALAVLAQFPYRIVRLRQLRTTVVERGWPIWFGYSLVAMLVVNWLGKVAGVW